MTRNLPAIVTVIIVLASAQAGMAQGFEVWQCEGVEGLTPGWSVELTSRINPVHIEDDGFAVGVGAFKLGTLPEVPTLYATHGYAIRNWQWVIEDTPTTRYRLFMHLGGKLAFLFVDEALRPAGDEYRLATSRGEQQVPDGWLQQHMIENALWNPGTPGVAVLLTGDGAGSSEGCGFHTTPELLHDKGWAIEVLSWWHSCKRQMREWAEVNGVFVALDDHYDAITFLEPSRPGFPLAPGRPAQALELKGWPAKPQTRPASGSGRLHSSQALLKRCKFRWSGCFSRSPVPSVLRDRRAA